MASLGYYRKQLKLLTQEVKQACLKLEIDQKLQQLSELETRSQQSDFWSDADKAQAISKLLANLKQQTGQWSVLRNNVAELTTLIKASDIDLLAVEALYRDVDQQFTKLKTQLRFTGRYDSYNVILSVYAGAGGTDAQDWAQMLLRMYCRWAEAAKVDYQLLTDSKGEEAGLKSVSMLLSGNSFLYGKLKGEHGVHRLVRLSPFNADNLRQTSFAKVEILPEVELPTEVTIPDADLKIDVFRSSGHGGQSVNTTDSAVRITHQPTGIVVSIQNERSQLQNKETAMKILRSRLVQLQLEQHATTISDLKGVQTANEWGSQIRNYVLHPYKLIKDVRSGKTVKDNHVQKVLDGDLDPFIEAQLVTNLSASNDA